MTSTVAEIALFLSRSPEISIVVKATILLGSGLMAARLAGRSRAALRHIIIGAAFGILVMLPIIVASGWRIPVAVPISGSTESLTALTDVLPSPEGRQPAHDTVGSGGAETITFSRFSWPGVIRFFWIIGVLAFLLPFGVNLGRLRRLRRNGLPCSALQERAAALAAACGIRRRVEVLLHEETPAPLMCGFWRPLIVLPVDARRWNETELRCTIVHELEHVRRGDWIMQLAARAICACYWFHPLVWVAWRQLCLEAERACDDAVIWNEERTEYADQLVSLARRMSRTHAQPALGMANRSDLSRRISAVLDSGQPRGPAGHLAAASSLVIAAIFVGGIAPLHAIAQLRGNEQTQSPSKPARRSNRLDRALYEAAESGKIPDIERLLNAGANINCALPGDGSPLIGAARAGQLGSVRFLLERGADPNMPVAGDGNPLIMAAREGHADVVTLLLDGGARIDELVPGDENALIQASGRGQLNVAQLLVLRGANVNERVWAEESHLPDGGEWRSPLSMARKGSHADVVAYLLSVGARE
jgi:beta-lactamase regulating signal transducer with metallopeptidase domain